MAAPFKIVGIDHVVLRAADPAALERASQAAGAKFFSVDAAPFSNFTRIANSLSTIDAFARAHPLKQPGAPAS